MKNTVLMLTGIILSGLTLMVVIAIYGRMNHSMELQSNLSSIMEETVSEMMSNREYSITNTNEFLADLMESLVISIDGKYDLAVDIMQIDMEKGILTVKVTASFLHPNGKVGTVECEKTVIFNQLIVAVLDTGYTGENARILKGVTTIADEENIEDGNGHGTRIIEMLLENTEEQVKILPIKIADYMGRSTEDAAYQGIKYAIENKVDIIHMSLNMSNLPGNSKLDKIMREAIDSGIDVVVSSGNNGKDAKNVFPANIEGAIVVSAIDEKNEFCDYSNYGDTIDFSAYGNYLGETGTSYSAARVTAMLAKEYINGGNVNTLRKKAIDMGEKGRDKYYGYGVLSTTEVISADVPQKAYIGKSKNDIGYQILDIDWREIDVETLDNYFAETYKAYVGMYLSRLDKRELAQLKQKSDILNTNVLVQDFKLDSDNMEYYEVTSYEENFAENAIKAYQEYEKELVVSAEWIMQKNMAYFAVSSENRDDIYFFEIAGFSYRTDTTNSKWFALFNPEKLTVTRTTIKQTTDFGEVYVSGMERYLRAANQFAFSYTDPSTGETVEGNNFYAIDAEVDTGELIYGLSIMIEGYSNQKTGYHTEETDIISIPYNYSHLYEEYSYEEYNEPLHYVFSYYKESSNTTEYAATPQRVEAQSKNFKKIVSTDQTIWYDGTYKDIYNYSDVDESLSFQRKLVRYLKSYRTKIISDVNIYSVESSLTATGFTINADLKASLGMQWNNGETTTVAVKNDIPEYNFPLVINTYTIVYDGNGATSGTMVNTDMTYNEEKALEENQYRRIGYVFRGWSTTPGGEVVYTDKQLVSNLTTSHNVIVTLYAVWDEFPWIIAEDLYYSLEDAQKGRITYEELMRHATAIDSETGGNVLPGIDEEKGTSFIILDYVATDYTELLQEENITEIYQVIDSIGNKYEKEIIVHIVDTSPVEIIPEGTTRFINEKYYNELYENGGLEENSIWKINPEFVETIQKAFANSRNKTPVFSFSFSYEEILLMKKFLQVNGVGNSRSEDALQRFFERFMQSDIVD